MNISKSPLIFVSTRTIQMEQLKVVRLWCTEMGPDRSVISEVGECASWPCNDLLYFESSLLSSASEAQNLSQL